MPPFGQKKWKNLCRISGGGANKLGHSTLNCIALNYLYLYLITHEDQLIWKQVMFFGFVLPSSVP